MDAKYSCFPYEPRRGQLLIMQSVFECISERKHMILESPTGSGKTVSVLSALLEARRGQKILYLTRTNSQQRQVMKELREIAHRKQIFGIAVQGRNNSCLLYDVEPEIKSGSPEELSAYCSRLKELTKGPDEGCRYYYGLTHSDGLEDWMRREMPDSEALVSSCRSMNVCPYELSKAVMHNADVVTAPYVYFFNPFIRRRLLEWMGTGIEKLMVVVDEAHNLPDYLRDGESMELTQRAVRAAASEASEYQDPEILEGYSIHDFAETMSTIIERMAEEYVLDEDGLVPESALETEIMQELHISSRGISGIVSALIGHGEFVRDMKLKAGKLPRSYIRYLGEFLRFWMGAESEYYVKVVNGGENKSIELYCLDPSIAAAPLLDTYASILMSGTIGNMQDFRNILRMPEDTVLLAVPSDFPRENRRIVYVADVTTKHDVVSRDAGMISTIAEKITSICNAVRRNTLVFLPSHAMLESLLSLNLQQKMEGKVLVERRGMPQQELMDAVEEFKRSRGAVFLCVIGGRVSEGMDFPDETLEMVIIAGIPYPRPTAKNRALVNYYDILYRKGWDYAVKDPALRRLIQASGRMIRSATDRGIAIVLDRRMATFRGVDAEEVADAAKEAVSFFSNVNR